MPPEHAVHGTAGEGGEGLEVRVLLRRRVVEVRLPAVDWVPDGDQHWMPIPYAAGELDAVLDVIADPSWQGALAAWAWYGTQWAETPRSSRGWPDLLALDAARRAPWLALWAWCEDGGTLAILRARRHDAGLED